MTYMNDSVDTQLQTTELKMCTKFKKENIRMETVLDKE